MDASQVFHVRFLYAGERMAAVRLVETSACIMPARWMPMYKSQDEQCLLGILTDFLLGFSDDPARTETVSPLSRLEGKKKRFYLRTKSKNFSLQHCTEVFPDGTLLPTTGRS